MIALNPFFTGSLVFIGIIFLAVIAFWIVYGIRKYRWAMITSIVVSSIFVFMLVTSGMRMIATRTALGPEEAAGFAKTERIMEKKDHRFLHKKEQFAPPELKDSRGPEINIEGLDKKEIEKIQDGCHDAESITIEGDDITIKIEK